MKKRVLLISLTILSLLILNLLIISAQSEPPVAGQEDYEKIKETTDKIPIDPETGGFDPSKLNESKSKAEQRIDSINEFLEKNVWWLKALFGMKPEISWLFFINFILILSLIANFRNIFVLFSSFSSGTATIIGIALALFAVQIQVTIKIASFIVSLLSKWWIKLIIFILVFVTLWISVGWGKWAAAMRLNRARMQLEIGAGDSKRLQRYVEKLESSFSQISS